MFGLRTTVSNHKTRLPLLFDTWITKVNTSQLFLVTDGDDPYAQLWMKVKGIELSRQSGRQSSADVSPFTPSLMQLYSREQKFFHSLFIDTGN